MYSFEYDHLERLSDSRHNLNASPSNSLEEKDISYDLNSNMLTMTRVNESGEEDDFTYSYSGNQLTSSIYDSNRDELQKMHPEIGWEYHIDVYDK